MNIRGSTPPPSCSGPAWISFAIAAVPLLHCVIWQDTSERRTQPQKRYPVSRRSSVPGVEMRPWEIGDLLIHRATRSKTTGVWRRCSMTAFACASVAVAIGGRMTLVRANLIPTNTTWLPAIQWSSGSVSPLRESTSSRGNQTPAELATVGSAAHFFPGF